MRPTRLLVLSLLAAACCAPRAHAACPGNSVTVGCWDGVGLSSDLLGYSYGEGAWDPSMHCRSGCFYLPEGLLIASARGVADPAMSCGASVDLEEKYVLEGVVSTGPVEFFAELTVEAARTGPGSFSGILFDFSRLPELVFAAQNVGPLDPTSAFTLWLPLQHSAGEAFVLYAGIGAGGHEPDGTSRATGHLRFSGLPPGAHLRPCRSYEVPVPAAQTSWGRLKARYIHR